MIEPRTAEVELSAPATLTVAAVARRLGVAPATLRTWSRRYGLGPTDHTAGAHRRYSANDVARLVVMRRLTHEGYSPAQAAQLARASAPQDAGSWAAAPITVTHQRLPPGGGRVIALPDASPAVRGLARATMTLDAAAVNRVLRRHLSEHGVITTWDDLAAPLLVGLGERYAATGEGVEVEHLFSECLMGVLRAGTQELTERRNTAGVVLACVGDEQHSLPLHAVQAALAEHGVGCRQLGMQVPEKALLSAVRRNVTAVVFLYAALPVERHHVLSVLARVRPAPRVLIGGPGWKDAVPSYVTRVSSLRETVEQIVACTCAAQMSPSS